MKFKKDDIVIHCPRQHLFDDDIEYRVIDTCIEEEKQMYLLMWVWQEGWRGTGEDGFGPDPILQYDLVQEDEIKSREDCKKCEYKLQRIIGMCPKLRKH